MGWEIAQVFCSHKLKSRFISNENKCMVGDEIG